MSTDELLKLMEKDPQECVKAVKDAIQYSYNRGVWHGGFALAGGVAIGAVIDLGVRYFKDRKEKKKVVE